MKLITAFELAMKNESELRAMFREASQNVVRSEPNTTARRNALATLENISRALCRAAPKP